MIIDQTAMEWNEALGLGMFRPLKSKTARRGIRRQTYVTGLRQAEEFWAAADASTTLVSPVLRYYALMQAGQAIAASSRLRDSQWQARDGHGLSITVPKVGADQYLDLNQVVVRVGGEGMAAQALAEALDSPLLAEPASLAQLIAALRVPRGVGRQPLFGRSSGEIRLPLEVSVQMQASAQISLLIIDGLDESIVQKCSNSSVPFADLRGMFVGYPSWRELPECQSATAEQDWMEGGPDFLRLEYPSPTWNLYSQFDPYFDEWATARITGRERNAWVYPSVGANDRAQHPLMTWYLVMYAFSMLARYHGAAWRRLLDKDETFNATLLEQLIQVHAQHALSLVGGVLKNQDFDEE